MTWSNSALLCRYDIRTMEKEGIHRFAACMFGSSLVESETPFNRPYMIDLILLLRQAHKDWNHPSQK